MAGKTSRSKSQSKSNSRSKAASGSKISSRSGGSRGRGTSSKSTAAQRQEMARKQVWAIVLFAVGILFLFLSIIKGQNFWLVLHNLLFGLFGWCGALLGPLLIYVAVMITMDKSAGSVRADRKSVV